MRLLSEVKYALKHLTVIIHGLILTLSCLALKLAVDGVRNFFVLPKVFPAASDDCDASEMPAGSEIHASRSLPSPSPSPPAVVFVAVGRDPRRVALRRPTL